MRAIINAHVRDERTYVTLNNNNVTLNLNGNPVYHFTTDKYYIVIDEHGKIYYFNKFTKYECTGLDKLNCNKNLKPFDTSKLNLIQLNHKNPRKLTNLNLRLSLSTSHLK